MTSANEIVKAIKCLRVQTGSLACMGCGHEHDCGVHGCAIMRQAADLIERLEKEKAALLEYAKKSAGCDQCKHETYQCDAECCHCEKECACGRCIKGNMWEWKGVKDE